MTAKTNTVLVVAPHPDDETLGCGGSLLRLAEDGATLIWLIVTGMDGNPVYTAAQRQTRAKTIKQISAAYPFAKTIEPGLPTAQLDTLPVDELVATLGKIINDVQPHYLLLPHAGDVHSDHRVVFDACAACSKWFRYPSIKRVMSYETLSETDFALPGSGRPAFQPNYFINISDQLTRKLEIMSLYESTSPPARHPIRLSGRRGFHVIT